MAAPYADFYFAPIPKKNLPAYRRLAQAAGKVFRRNGALEYREFVADDLRSSWGTVPFPKVIKLRRGEILIGAIVGFRSRTHRDRTNTRISKDPAMQALTPKKPIFDTKRVVYGGFRGIVQV